MLQTVKSYMTKENLLTLAFGAILFALMASAAHAGSMGGDEFEEIYDTITGWMQGSLGRTLALGMILIGVAGGMARQSVMTFAVGVGAGLGLMYAPGIIENIMSATLPAVEVGTQVVEELSNKVGLL